MRICIVPEYPMNLMTGGLQFQALETCKALCSLGGDMSAELFEWSKMGPPADLYHFIGFPEYLSRIVDLVDKAGRASVITMLFGGGRSRVQMQMAAARRVFSSRILKGRGRDHAIAQAKAIITITEGDAEAARTVFGVDKEKIEVVPNGVADGFFNCALGPWQKAYGDKEFVLCVGAVQERKNQLFLTQVCNRLKLPLVLLGPVLPGEAQYGQRVGEAMAENGGFGGRWLRDLRNEDDLLRSAYAACRVFVLLSNSETQPLSVMQAMAARKRILLRNAGYAEDQLLRHLPRVTSLRLSPVAEALRTVWEGGKETELSVDYSWRNVARRLQNIYKQALDSK